MEIVTLGIDLGKELCSVVGMDSSGAVVVRKRLRRDRLCGYVGRLPRCVIGLEACFGAHYLGRRFISQGHTVRLMPPEYVRRYRLGQKNDDRDAEGVAEAATRPTMREVAVKSQAQLDVQTLHRARSRLVGQRTALINHLRAVLLERGVVVARGRQRLAVRLPVLLAEDNAELSPRLRVLIEALRDEWRALDARIAAYDKEFRTMAREDPAARRLMTIPGIGPLTATALAAAVGDGSSFGRGRDLAAWLGLVPRQNTTGGKPRLGGITKRGNTYLRQLLIHGARAALPHLVAKPTPLGHWLRQLQARHHHNVVVVALANKLARIAWVVLARGTSYAAEVAA